MKTFERKFRSYRKTGHIMNEDNNKREDIEEVNDENPDNFTRFGNGHIEKIQKKYTDGEPPHEDEESYADPEHPLKDIPKKKYI